MWKRNELISLGESSDSMEINKHSYIRNYNELMKYRQLGSTGPFVSLLGFGGLRFRARDESIKAIHEAIAVGVNFIETCPEYGDSELIIGDAIEGRRDNVYISTKCSPVDRRAVPISQDDVFKNVEKSLKRLRIDKIDLYNMWHIQSYEHFEAARKKNGYIDGIRKLMDQGVIDHFGFSSHNSPETVRKYIDSREFESAIMVYNIFDTTYERIINYAYSQGLGVIAMKPLHGGMLALPLKSLSFLTDKGSNEQAIISLKFAMSLPFISTAISGMTNISEVQNNIRAVRNIGGIDSDYRHIISKKFKNACFHGIKLCSGCGYCDHCPVGIPIPKLTKLQSIMCIYDSKVDEFREYAKAQGVSFNNYNECQECGECENMCPEHLNIIERIKELRKVLQ